MLNVGWYDRYKTRKELEDMLTKEYGDDICIARVNSKHKDIRMADRDIYKPAKKRLEVWDGTGNGIGVFLGYKPINGGTTVYLVG